MYINVQCVLIYKVSALWYKCLISWEIYTFHAVYYPFYFRLPFFWDTLYSHISRCSQSAPLTISPVNMYLQYSQVIPIVCTWFSCTILFSYSGSKPCRVSTFSHDSYKRMHLQIVSTTITLYTSINQYQNGFEIKQVPQVPILKRKVEQAVITRRRTRSWEWIENKIMQNILSIPSKVSF